MQESWCGGIVRLLAPKEMCFFTYRKSGQPMHSGISYSSEGCERKRCAAGQGWPQLTTPRFQGLRGPDQAVIAPPDLATWMENEIAR
jgi:hypothetical protein